MRFGVRACMRCTGPTAKVTAASPECLREQGKNRCPHDPVADGQRLVVTSEFERNCMDNDDKREYRHVYDRIPE